MLFKCKKRTVFCEDFTAFNDFIEAVDISKARYDVNICYDGFVNNGKSDAKIFAFDVRTSTMDFEKFVDVLREVFPKIYKMVYIPVKEKEEIYSMVRC